MTRKLLSISIAITAGLLISGCGKIEPQITKLKGLITKDSPAASKEKTVFEIVPTEPVVPTEVPAEQANLETCVDQRVDAFRKENGEERAINYDVLEEWESECKENSYTTAGTTGSKTLEKTPYRIPKLFFEEVDLIQKMRASGVDDFYLKDIQAYLKNPENYWTKCVNGYADESKQSGGYGEAEAQKYGEQACKAKTNALYACLNEESIKSAASCLKKEMEEEMANAD